MSEILGDTVCPECRKNGGDKTGNHLMLFSDGGSYCNRCEYREPAETFTAPRANFGEEKSDEELQREVEEVQTYPIRAIPGRKIAKRTAERFGVRSSLSETHADRTTAVHFPSRKGGEIQGYKVRYASGKNFGKAGRTKASEFFGAEQCPKNGKKLFITEGEFDAMALYEIFFKHTEEKWQDWISIVSLSHGANSAKVEVILNKELIEGFEQIVCVFDQDEAGRKASEDVKAALKDKDVFYPKFNGNDPCEVLQQGDTKELYWSCIQAKAMVRPEKIISGSEISLEEILVPLKKGVIVPYPMLMDKLHGFRYGDGGGELTVCCAGSGMGKTTFAREIFYNLNKEHKLTLGHIFLEEQHRKTSQSYIALDNNIPLGMLREDPSCIPFERVKASHEELIDNDRCFFLTHFGSLASTSLMDYMYHLHYEGCQFIGLDHISMVVSGEKSGSGGERKDLDILMTKLAAFCEDTGTSVLAIVHLKRPQQGSFNEGKAISLTDLRGSAAIEQLSHNIFSVEGDQQGDNPHSRIIRVLKNREWGDIGLADQLEYNPETGRMLPVRATFGGAF